MKGEAPRLSSSHGCATCCTQVPILESRQANQNVPKRRVRRSLIELLKVLVGLVPVFTDETFTDATI